VVDSEGTLLGNYSTDASGIVVVPATSGTTYTVTEIAWPAGYRPLVQTQTVTVEDSGSTVSFRNIREEEDPDDDWESTPDVYDPGEGDPSGYVYEGIESNRLEDVTATLYHGENGSGLNSTKWDAEAHGQINPQLTDSQGQYLWMVPSGWWQVTYEKDGYISEESEWMVVPPIRTNVNQNLTRYGPASMTVEYSKEAHAIILRFDRPIELLSEDQLAIEINGQPLQEDVGYDVSAVDSGWSDTQDPADSKLCATTFTLHIDQNLGNADVSVSVSDAVTYNGSQSDTPDTGRTTVPNNVFTVTVTGGSGSGNYLAGEEVTIQSEPGIGSTFLRWTIDGAELSDETAASATFIMPWNDVTVQAVYDTAPQRPVRPNIPSRPAAHTCASKCDVCGGCEDADCTANICKDKCLLLSMNFTDVSKGTWYTDAVEYVYHRNMMQGVGDNLFDINGTTTRAMIVTILWRLEGEPICGQGKSGTFGDVPEYTWYTEAVEWAAASSIVGGYGDANQSFGPNDPITREQFAAILWRYARFKGYDVSVGESTDIIGYKDAFSVSEYAVPAMRWACGAGLMQGDGVNLTPGANATRAQAAALFQRFCEKVVK